MSRSQLIQEIEKGFLHKNCPEFKIGDTVRVHIRIVEGQKERNQVFAGIVIAMKGCGINETFTVYRNAYGCSMEKVFMRHSPRLSKVEVMRSGKVSRAKLYYLCGKAGKAAKIDEKIHKKISAALLIEEAIEPVESPAETQE